MKETFDHIKMGDKVIWMLVILLMLISLVAVFSSNTRSAASSGSHLGPFIVQFCFVVAGFALMLGISAIPGLKHIRGASKFGFILSLFLLLFLNLRLDFGPNLRTIVDNGACRSIKCMGFTIQVLEIVKVAMVLYMAWAVQTYGSGKFKLNKFLSDRWPEAFGWTLTTKAQRWIFIFGPLIITTALTVPASNSSAIICFFIMLVTILVGGIKMRDLIGPFLSIVILVFLATGLHIVTNGHFISRMETFFSRLKIEAPYPDPVARKAFADKIAIKKADPRTLKVGSKEYEAYLDGIYQSAAAELAVVEGGRRIIGKGPGRSTQKYVVPVMNEDYMFSLIVEEYGIFAGFALIMIYMSFFARCNIIVRNSTNRYARAAVAGMGALITFQAFFHILINCNVVGFTSGQTLPFVSYGRGALICYSIGVGVILCISTLANKSIMKEQEEAARLLAQQDDIQASLSVVESIDDMEDIKKEQDNESDN